MEPLNEKRNGNDQPKSWTPENNNQMVVKKKFPYQVCFIIGSEFCERFSFYGMRAILLLYFITEHGYHRETAYMLFHAFIVLAYTTPLLGSIMADNYFGRYKVILWVSVFYVLGHVLITIGAVPELGQTFRQILDFTGLLVIAVATGGIKPCVSAFGADQFEEGNTYGRQRFFSFFYLAINAGSLLAILITPLLKERVSCMGSQYCFPLAFGVPGALMAIALVVFLAGTPLYRHTKLESNVVWNVFATIIYAIKQSCSSPKKKVEHWLDRASPKYSREIIEGVKSLSRVMIVLAPVVVFWALFDQQGSTWIIQATNMNGRLGNINILPEQMNTLNPIFILVLVPLVDFVMSKLKDTKSFLEPTPLRRMGIGGILAAFSFCAAGFVQIRINSTLVQLPPESTTNVTLYFVDFQTPFTATFEAGGSSASDRQIFEVSPPSVTKGRELNFVQYKTLISKAGPESKKNSQLLSGDGWSVELELSVSRNKDDKLMGYAVGIFRNPSDPNRPHVSQLRYPLIKTPKGGYSICPLWNNFNEEKGVYLAGKEGSDGDTVKTVLLNNTMDSDCLHIIPGITSPDYYSIGLIKNRTDVFQELIRYKGVSGESTVLLMNGVEGGRSLSYSQRNLIPANSVPILWQVPQFFLISLGEVLFSISGLEFSYTQAAPCMRSFLQTTHELVSKMEETRFTSFSLLLPVFLLTFIRLLCTDQIITKRQNSAGRQALWLETVAAGNVIDMIVSGTPFIKDPMVEFFVFAGLMAFVMLLFILIASRYEYVDNTQWIESDSDSVNGLPHAKSDDIELHND